MKLVLAFTLLVCVTGFVACQTEEIAEEDGATSPPTPSEYKKVMTTGVKLLNEFKTLSRTELAKRIVLVGKATDYMNRVYKTISAHSELSEDQVDVLKVQLLDVIAAVYSSTQNGKFK